MRVFKIYQRMRGFIANSSGAAFFQFYLMETPKKMSTSDLLNEFGIKPYSIAHELLEKTGILEYFLSTRRTPEYLNMIVKGTYPDSYAYHPLEYLLKMRYKQLPDLSPESHDYFCDFVGSGIEGWYPKDNDETDRAFLGFVQLLQLSEDKKSKFIAEDVYYRIY